eukprot:s2258_g11.t1
MSGLDFIVEGLEPENLEGDSMKGFRRHLQQAPSFASLHLHAFAMKASLGQSLQSLAKGGEGIRGSIPIQADNTEPTSLALAFACFDGFDGDPMIHKVTDEQFEKTFAPEVRDNLEIFATTQQEDWSWDFFWCFSSVVVALGNYCQVAFGGLPHVGRTIFISLFMCSVMGDGNAYSLWESSMKSLAAELFSGSGFAERSGGCRGLVATLKIHAASS